MTFSGRGLEEEAFLRVWHTMAATTKTPSNSKLREVIVSSTSVTYSNAREVDELLPYNTLLIQGGGRLGEVMQ